MYTQVLSARMDWSNNISAILSRIYDLRYNFLFILLSYITYRVSRVAIFTYHVRQRYHDIPSLPRHWFGGNLKSAGEAMPPSSSRHPDYGMERLWKDLGRPPCYLMDLAPVDTPMLVVAEPQVAEAITQPSAEYKYSIPKSDTVSALHRLIGRESIISAEGEEWRNLRRRFNKGFAPAHLHSLSTLIISKTQIFINRLQQAAQVGKVFELKEFAQDLTTDIITQLAMEKDFESQSVPSGEGPKSALGVLTASRLLSSLTQKVGQGFHPLALLNLIRPTKAWFYEQIFDRELYSVLSQKLRQEQKQPKKKDASAKAIVQLALADMEPTPALLKNTVAQIKSFLFAGQDTTATLIQWLCFELSKVKYDQRYEEILEKLKTEHDSVFGPGAYSALEVLRQPGKAEELLGDKIPYTTAFIKETLRIHPPAGTARLIPRASDTVPPFSVDIDGKITRIDGLRIYVCHWIVHRNHKIWGADAHTFRPDRWLDESYMSNLPAGAWRPFERGPRNCIGQELALMEGKVVMCAVSRGLAFEKVGLTGFNGEDEVWGTSNVTTVPVDGMVMKVHLKK